MATAGIEWDERDDSETGKQNERSRTTSAETQSSEANFRIDLKDIPDVNLFDFEAPNFEHIEPEKKASTRSSVKPDKEAKTDEIAKKIQFVVNKGIGYVGMMKPEIMAPIAEGVPSIADVIMLNDDEAKTIAEFQSVWFPTKKLTKKMKQRIEKGAALIGLATVVGSKIYAVNQLLNYQKELAKNGQNNDRQQEVG